MLPWWLWGPALALALTLLAVAGRAQRGDGPQGIAYQGAMGALMLAAMAVQIPLGPIEYHLVLLGPIGVLLGAAGAFQVVFVVSAMLALIGHGGLTVVGLNVLVLGAGVAIARPVFVAVKRRRSAVFAMVTATAVAQAVAGVLWVATVGATARWANPGGTPLDPHRIGWAAGIVLPLLALGLVVECAVAAGIARFLARVRPDLLPGAAAAAMPREGTA